MDDRHGRKNRNRDEGQTGVITKTAPKTKKPSLYKVLLLNDDFTPMEFVVDVLERFFNKGREEATRIMLHVHQKGIGVCGVYTHEVAETKIGQVMDFARQHQQPLQCTMGKGLEPACRSPAVLTCTVRPSLASERNQTFGS